MELGGGKHPNLAVCDGESVCNLFVSLADEHADKNYLSPENRGE